VITKISSYEPLTIRLQIVLAFISLYNLLGWPAFVGVAVMVFSIPINTGELVKNPRFDGAQL
jgi:hypothetical protein